MKLQKYLLLIGLGLMIALMLSLSLTPRPALAEVKKQSSACDEILINAARQAGVKGAEMFASVNDGSFSCSVFYTYYGSDEPDGVLVTNLDITETELRSDPVYECTGGGCKVTTFHGYPAILYIWDSNQTSHLYWYVEPGTVAYDFYAEERFTGSEDYMPVAEALWSAADGKLPQAAVPPSEPGQSNSDCAGVTPEKLRAGGVAVLACRLHCDPNMMSDDELWACIDQYSGQSGSDVPIIPEDQPGGDVPIIPEDSTGSDQPESLGPLATNPLVPLA
ncbi:MAG: hypothetical protein MUO77_15415, partial [Anaerolineales bacterium]|nr:hypothetical protein [Anaerolineales bacterium]